MIIVTYKAGSRVELLCTYEMSYNRNTICVICKHLYRQTYSELLNLVTTHDNISTRNNDIHKAKSIITDCYILNCLYYY